MTGRAQRIPGRKHQPSLRLVERAPETRPGCAARRTHSVPASGHGDAEALAAVRRHGQHGALARRSGGQAGLSGHRLGPGERRRPQDRSGAWLGTAAAGLAVLAGAAATVSFSAQYQMVHAARGVVVVAALEAAIPDTAALIFASLGIALALHGRRAVRSRLLNLASIGTSVVMNVLAAAPGWRDLAIWALPPVAYALASDTLISVVRATAIARHQVARQVAADEPTPLALIGGLLLWLIRLAVAPASTLRGLRAWVLDECPVAPGRRSNPAAATAAAPGRAGQADAGDPSTTRCLAARNSGRNQDRAVPGPGQQRARPARGDPAGQRVKDLRAGRAASRAERRGSADSAARGNPRSAGRESPMIKYLIALAVLLVAAAFASWAFLPARYLPGNRARHLRIRVHLRLHPGKGFATVASLHLRWGRIAALRRSGRIRRSLPFWARVLWPSAHSVFLGRAHYRHGLRVPLEEHILVVAPPRTYKTAFLADVILRYPGAVLATTTKADVYQLTSAARSCRGPVYVFNPQGIGGVASTFRWSPIAGCEDPATAIRRADGFAYAVSQKGVEEATFWSSKASDYLRAYFHAAALAGYDLRAVAAWVAGGNPGEAEQILLDAGAAQWAFTLAEMSSEAQKTAATVRMVMSRALAFMADPALAAAVLPARRRELQHRRLPRRDRHRVHDGRLSGRGRPGRPAVRLHGYRDPLPGRPDRPGLRIPAPRPGALNGPRRGHADLPGAVAGVAQ